MTEEEIEEVSEQQDHDVTGPFIMIFVILIAVGIYFLTDSRPVIEFSKHLGSSGVRLAAVCLLAGVFLQNTLFIVATSLTAWLLRIEVKEISLGLGPTIAVREFGSVLFLLKLIPIQSYTKFHVEEASNPDEKPIWFSDLYPIRSLLIGLLGTVAPILTGWLLSGIDISPVATGACDFVTSLPFHFGEPIVLAEITNSIHEIGFWRTVGSIILVLGILNALPFPTLSGWYTLNSLFAIFSQKSAQWMRSEMIITVGGIAVLLLYLIILGQTSYELAMSAASLLFP